MAKNNPINYSDFFNDDGAIDKLIKKLNEVDEIYARLSTGVAKSFDNMSKKAQEFDTTTEDGRKQIEKLEKELEKLIKANKELKDSEGELTDKKKQALRLAKEEAKLLRKKNDITTEAALKNQELKEEIREGNKVLKQSARENKGLVGEYERQSRTLIKLRKEYKNLAVSGQANTVAAQKLLVEVTALDQKLKIVDKTVGQSQRNVGNYGSALKGAGESAKDFAGGLTGAIDESGALKEVSGKLGVVISFLKKAQKNLKAETQKSTKALAEQKIVANALDKSQSKLQKSVARAGKAFKVFNTILKASLIGVIILALASLAASLARTQAGLNKLRAITISSGAIISEVAARLIALGPALMGLVKLTTIPIRVLINLFGFLSDKITVLELKAARFFKTLKNPFADTDSLDAQISTAEGKLTKSTAGLGKVFTDIPKDFNAVTSGFSVFNGFLDKLKD